eukprot:COSAG02_NODE_5816_length_4017_cov_4.466820_1_plen_40_part_00
MTVIESHSITHVTTIPHSVPGSDLMTSFLYFVNRHNDAG